MRSISKCVRASLGLSVSIDIKSRVAPVAPDRRVDRPGPCLRPAVDERQVLARQPPRGEHLLELSVHVIAAGDHEQAGRVAVESVDDPRPRGLLAPAGRSRQRLGERAGPVPARRVDHDPGRLVDHEQVLVLIGDRERRRLQHRGRRRLLAELDDDPLARGDGVALGPQVPVDLDEPRFDQRLGACARAERLGEEPVEPRPRGRDRDLQLDHSTPGHLASITTGLAAPAGPPARTAARSPRT